RRALRGVGHEESDVLTHGVLKVGREPGSADEEDTVAARERLPGRVVVGAVDALVEVARLDPLLERRGRLLVLWRRPARAGVAQPEGRDGLGVDVVALQRSEDVDGWPLL